MAHTLISMIIFAALTVPFGQTQSSHSIRQVNLKDAAYQEAVRTLHEYWGTDDWVQESNVQEFQTNIAYGDLTGDGSEEAAVQVHYTMGGSGSFTGVFVYTLQVESPKLMGTVKGGDRAQGGIKSVRIQNGQLIVESYGPDEQGCMACYGSVATTRYEWLGGSFVHVSETVRGIPRQRTARPQRKRRTR
jgi:hypothetical protein